MACEGPPVEWNWNGRFLKNKLRQIHLQPECNRYHMAFEGAVAGAVGRMTMVWQQQMTVTTSSAKLLSATPTSPTLPPSPTEQSVAARGADGPTRSGCCGCEPVRTGRPTIPAVSQSDSSGRRIGRAEGSSGEVRAVWGLHSSGGRVVS